MRILYAATLSVTINAFMIPHIRMLVDAGHHVDIACQANTPLRPELTDMGCCLYDIPFSRSPLSKDNIAAFHQLDKVIAEGHYDIVHCHTPVAAAVTRLVCRKYRKYGLRVFYTAHGFHFYQGAPLKNWLVYYPVEWLCAHWTDTLLTINQEDYALAKKHMHAGRVAYVPGVGIDLERYKCATVDCKKKREELGIPADAFLMISVGELNQNKNHEVIIKALSRLNDLKIHYMIAGKGPLEEYLTTLANDLNVSAQVHLLGFRNDVAELYKTANVDVFPSIREGLGLAAVEGMAAGLPLICADNRGTREYAIQNKNAFVCRADDICAFAEAIEKMAGAHKAGMCLLKTDFDGIQRFAIAAVNANLLNIYNGH